MKVTYISTVIPQIAPTEAIDLDTRTFPDDVDIEATDGLLRVFCPFPNSRNFGPDTFLFAIPLWRFVIAERTSDEN